MVAMVRKYKSDAAIGDLARKITASVGERDARAIVTVLHRWVRDQIKYVMDPRGTEMVQTPPRTVEIGTGDCDDKSSLLATLLESMGYATRFVAVGLAGEGYSHVLAEVHLGARWVPLETILPGREVGWFPPDATSVMYAHV